MLDQAGNLNALEFLWLVEGAIGIALSTAALVAAFKDRLEITKAQLNHGMDVLSKSNIMTEGIRFAEQGFVLTIGIIAATISPSPLPSSPIGWAITVMLIMIPVMVAINTFNSLYVRKLLVSLTNEN